MSNTPQQDPYAQNPQDPYGQQNPYGQNPYGQDAYGQTPTGQQQPYAQNPYTQTPHGQQPTVQGYADPYGQQVAYGTQPYGYGSPTGNAPMRPSMGMGQSIKAFFQNYARFNGRAGLSEFWWAQLCIGVISLVLYVLVVVVAAAAGDHAGGVVVAAFIILMVWSLAIIVPSLALNVRRLHDTNRSGWMLLLTLIPMVGSIILLVFYCGHSEAAGARFDGAEQPKLGN